MTLFAASPSSGFLVTVEGPNGAGKTSVAAEIAAHLRAAGADVHTTQQPSPTPLGDTVRAAEREVKGRALACLVAGDRHHQAESEILPRLSRGAIVLCDRYIESSLVLQRIDGVDIEYILAINAGIPRPRLRIQLSAEAGLLRRRLSARPSSPERRFEHSAGAERELQFYAEADQLLTTRELLPARTFDTTASDVRELGATLTDLILSMR